MSKKLAAYFSATGMTAVLAKSLTEAASADLYEIKPKVPYTEADLNWNNKQSHSSIEMNDQSYRPVIADKDVIFQERSSFRSQHLMAVDLARL